MRIVVESDKVRWNRDETVVVRILAINDSYRTVTVDRRLLIGPTPVVQGGTGLPHPVSMEPAFATDADNLVLLNPWGIYGRERTFDPLPPGSVTFHGYLLVGASAGLLPEGPADPAMLLTEAIPLVLEIIQ